MQIFTFQIDATPFQLPASKLAAIAPATARDIKNSSVGDAGEHSVLHLRSGVEWVVKGNAQALHARIAERMKDTAWIPALWPENARQLGYNPPEQAVYDPAELKGKAEQRLLDAIEALETLIKGGRPELMGRYLPSLKAAREALGPLRCDAPE